MTYQSITGVILLIIFFAGRHSWSALKGKRSTSKTRTEIRKGRFWIFLIVYALAPIFLFVVEQNQNFSFLYFSVYESVFYAVGLIFSLFGLFLMFWTRIYRQRDWGFMGDDGGEKLFVGGPHAITRHPYYMGAIFFGIGLYLIMYTWLVLIMVITCVFIYFVIRDEEFFLENKFGQKWVEYKKGVGILPWL